MRFIRFLVISIILAAPSLAWGSIYEGRLEVRDDDRVDIISVMRVAGITVGDRFRLQLGCLDFGADIGCDAGPVTLDLPMEGTLSVAVLNGGGESRALFSLPNVAGSGVDVNHLSADRTSMVSYLWSELFAGVDLVSEVRIWADGMRDQDHVEKDQVERDTRSAWKLRFTYRTNDDVELIARVNGRGNLMRSGKFALELNASDVILDEIGVSAAYRDGQLDIELDNVKLNNTMTAMLSMEF